MKEKLKAFFTSDKLRGTLKRIFSKKVIIVVVSVFVVLAALRIAFTMIFQVNGVVKKIDGKNLVVANFLTTRTVDIGDYPLDNRGIQVGERVKILKNLSGDILYIKAQHKDSAFKKDQLRDGTKQKNIKDQDMKGRLQTPKNGMRQQTPDKQQSPARQQSPKGSVE